MARGRAWWRAGTVLVALLLALVTGAVCGASTTNPAPAHTGGHPSTALTAILAVANVAVEDPARQLLTGKRAHPDASVAAKRAAAPAVRLLWSAHPGGIRADAVNRLVLHSRAPPVDVTV
jgi:hypothetical protein